MGRFLRNHPLITRMSSSLSSWTHFLTSKIKNLSILTSFILILAINSISQAAYAEGLNIPIQRSIATQPISTLEVISTVKTLLNGRVLSLKKKSTYTNPDCYHVKFLEDKGEFQLITVGCGMEKMAKS